ncbi:MAG: hypothetical protein CM15mV13_0020 [uncultured marine virus]|nr:MAG: hypothetical protein CM15mV13_0020 [uncultured marine virus]
MDDSILSDNLTQSVTDTSVYGLFMVPIGKYTNKKHNEHKAILVDFWIKSILNLHPIPKTSICYNITQLGDNAILEHQALATIKETIQKAVFEVNSQSYCYEWEKFQEIQFSDSYIEVAGAESMYAPYEQSNVLYSGCYFINYLPDKHSPLKFNRAIGSPHYPIMQGKHSKITPFNNLTQDVPTSEGDILIFPSNLSRGFELNSTPNRLTLTFNCF